MSGCEEWLLQRAAEAFTQGHYERAKHYYQQASVRFGGQLFVDSVALCDLRLGESAGATASGSETHAASGLALRSSFADVAEQLSETQALLEKYYNRCQELEYQLLERKEGRTSA